MMNVPRSVIIGKSPMNTVCSLISPVFAFRNCARTKIGAEYVVDFSRHSSTVNLGTGRRSGSSGSNSKRSSSCPEKSVIGLMSSNAFASPCNKNELKLSRWTAIRSGSGSVSSKSANEKRSGLMDRAGNGLLLFLG